MYSSAPLAVSPFSPQPGRMHPVNHRSIAGVDQVDANALTADLAELPLERWQQQLAKRA
jgi:hypothetical protein